MEEKIRKTYHFSGYTQRVHYLLESKQIYFIDCTCGNFSGVYRPKEIVNGKVIREASWFPGKRLKNSGQFSDKRFYAEPCKHLKPIIDIAAEQGFTLKKPKPMEGTDKCDTELRRIIFDRSGGICEMLGCGHPGIEVHRKTPKTNGGKYNEDNCILLCLDCHHNITFQKWQGSPGKKKEKVGKKKKEASN